MEKQEAFFPEFSKSPAYKEKFPDVAFGITMISDCTNHPNPPEFDLYKRKLLRKMRRRETLRQIQERIAIYEKFFSMYGFECPLPAHLKRTVASGFPRYNLMVDTHFLAEMCHGILVAVADFDRFEGKLSLDIAEEGESFLGMGQRQLRTKEGEILLRDEKDIVCILCQGADEKTRITEDTGNVIFYAYAVPGIDEAFIYEGLDLAAQTMERFGGGTITGVKTF